MAEISDVLRESFRAHSDDPGHLESVIVTLQPDADATQLEAAGMQIETRIRSRPIVSGRIDARAFKSLSELPDVVRIESDSTMHALGS